MIYLIPFTTTSSLAGFLYNQFSKQMSASCIQCFAAVGGVWLQQLLEHQQSRSPRSYIQLEDFSGDKGRPEGPISRGSRAVPSPPVPPSVRGSKSIVRIMASSSIIQIRAHVY